MRRIWPGEEPYLKSTGEKVEIISVDDWTIPHKYSFKYEDGTYAHCHRSDLCLRKPKNEKRELV